MMEEYNLRCGVGSGECQKSSFVYYESRPGHPTNAKTNPND